jgi:hypothetical protein
MKCDGCPHIHVKDGAWFCNLWNKPVAELTTAECCNATKEQD